MTLIITDIGLLAKGTYMTAMEELEIEMAEEKWTHEVIEELEDDEALEEHFQDCIQARIPPDSNN